jgi:hypothetical protein
MPFSANDSALEGLMKLGSDYPNVEKFAAAIARSQIVVPQPHSPMTSLPGEFDDVDIAILGWIAAESRGSRNLLWNVGRAVSALFPEPKGRLAV